VSENDLLAGYEFKNRARQRLVPGDQRNAASDPGKRIAVEKFMP